MMRLFSDFFNQHGHVLYLIVAPLLLGTASSVQAQSIDATRVANGLALPVFVTAPAGDTDRLFIVEQRLSEASTTGRIRILDLNSGTMNATPFLAVTGLSNISEEQGLLGMAFHPDYENNGFFYLTESFVGHTDIRRYQVSAGNPDVANLGSATTILTYSQPHDCHNGNWIGFGPDGMLYHTSGDGGSQGDLFLNGQDKTTLNGSVVRINVGADGLADDFPADPNRNYSIPATNPFVGEGGGVREELWSYGLRNPWRASFDRLTGDFYIGDTSQDTLELINFEHAGSPGGLNYGWPLREGTIEMPRANGGSKPPGAIDPIYEYPQNLFSLGENIGSATAEGTNQGVAVIGGYVYRGPVNALNNEYFFADIFPNVPIPPNSGRLWSFEFDGTQDPLAFSGQNHNSSFKNWEIIPDFGTVEFISSFGEDAEGNLYAMNYISGELFRLDPDYFDADFELDKDVDADDFAIWTSAFGAGTYGDADADADTDGNDFLVWQQDFGKVGPTALQNTAAQVPEPSAALLLGLALITIGISPRLRTRRREDRNRICWHFRP
jgi:glucose/arabinose dehydrogenase